ncbi:MAG: hypothetical protein M3088_06365 [Actinomycetota bacterium]|nr:hypothetical protein [Actinomycetota bacterium]
MDAVESDRPVLLGGPDGARSLAARAATQLERAGALIAVLPTAEGAAVEAPEVAETIARSFVDANWPGALVDVWAPDWARAPPRGDRMTR